MGDFAIAENDDTFNLVDIDVEYQHKFAKVIASNAKDAEDARELLEMLGFLPYVGMVREKGNESGKPKPIRRESTFSIRSGWREHWSSRFRGRELRRAAGN